jgi:hypothetical protein
MKELIRQKKVRRFVVLEKLKDGTRGFHIYDEELKKIC